MNLINELLPLNVKVVLTFNYFHLLNNRYGEISLAHIYSRKYSSYYFFNLQNMQGQDYRIIELGKRKKIMFFRTGKFYLVVDDLITPLEIKTEIQINKKTFKIYRSSYIYFDGKKRSPAKLIATAFVHNPNQFSKLKRIQPNILNNSYDNLIWVNTDKDYSQRIITAEDLKNIDYSLLCDYNKILYEFVVNGNEEFLYKFIYTGSFRRYLYKSYYDRGLPDSRFDLFLDQGYDVLKKRLKKYYSFKINTDNQARKYIYLTMYFSALALNIKEPLIKLDFLPRELKNRYQDYDDNFLEDLFEN